MIAARFIVAGKVQGVGFRASTRVLAVALGIAGFARNLTNGDVDVLAVGDVAAIARLEDWLRTGPPQAEVRQLLREDVPLPSPATDGFAIC